VTRNYTSNQLNQYTAIDNPTAALTYDFDGNAVLCPLSSGNWAMTWDAENRLAVAEKTGQRLEFKYDYMSRRVEKRVLDGGSETSKERFVYDGFLQIEELDALDSNNILKKRVWEPGGNRLLSESHSFLGVFTSFYALSDANKNITEYIDSTGIIQAHFEYSPFGKITVASGLMPDNFDFRFSSEYFDPETSLVYYNFRYYSPELGRWMTRDPIEEQGGTNLYAMAVNDAVNGRDYLGWLECSFSKILDQPEWTYVGSDPYTYKALSERGPVFANVTCKYKRTVRVEFKCPCECLGKTGGFFFVDFPREETIEKHTVGSDWWELKVRFVKEKIRKYDYNRLRYYEVYELVPKVVNQWKYKRASEQIASECNKIKPKAAERGELVNKKYSCK
jgi:RHS repeat-associated protein